MFCGCGLYKLNSIFNCDLAFLVLLTAWISLLMCPVLTFSLNHSPNNLSFFIAFSRQRNASLNLVKFFSETVSTSGAVLFVLSFYSLLESNHFPSLQFSLFFSSFSFPSFPHHISFPSVLQASCQSVHICSSFFFFFTIIEFSCHFTGLQCY